MTRWEIINFFILTRGYKSFLEIGTAKGDTFNRVIAERKVSVDPDTSTAATYHMTSDEFFMEHQDKFDIIFIDGLHLCQQVYSDITNGLSHLNRNGTIVMHDCHPYTYMMQVPIPKIAESQWWTGDVWKAFVRARATLPYEMYVIDDDLGCGVIDTSVLKQSNTDDLPIDMKQMRYKDFLVHPEWMNYKYLK